ncbi:MAG: glycosyltransferase family 2 protein [Xanthomonadales bacterium]|nr:glycosyltransferase family 2 protein [Gammaproteobacteria bacterium]NNE04704.1 glycosyltransferase family 2 protein [Xanthomonadales bacterium]NNL95319.1 glycosyltransferase family 2 protein [Xanthomonadales bacterium]
MEFRLTGQLHNPKQKCVSIVVPVYNEAEVLEETFERLRSVLRETGQRFEIVFVDDGSKDGSRELLESIQAAHPQVVVVLLSRNFGKEYALTAGLDFACGEAVIMIDADLQDPPELIPQMLDKWQQGFDVVTMRRVKREGETVAKRSSAWLFYRLLNRISDVDIPPDTGDFRLLSARAVRAIRQMPERVRYMKGIFAWIGFEQTEITYERSSRAAGRTKWGYLRLFRLALDGITAFSTVPLRLASYLGFITAMLAFAYGVWTIIKTLVYGDPVAGFPTLMTSMLFLGGVQLMAIGLLGEYLGRLFTESKNRPHYLVSEVLRDESASAGAPDDTSPE